VSASFSGGGEAGSARMDLKKFMVVWGWIGVRACAVSRKMRHFVRGVAFVLPGWVAGDLAGTAFLGFSRLFPFSIHRALAFEIIMSL
jgi:hypothetical protein